MSGKNNNERSNICTTAEDFDNFQTQTMYEENEFITLSDILPPQPQIPDLANDIQEMPSESDIVALNYKVKVTPTHLHPDSDNKMLNTTEISNVSVNSTSPFKTQRGRRRTKGAYSNRNKGRGRKISVPAEININETLNVCKTQSLNDRIIENDINTLLNQNFSGQQENVSHSKEFYHKPAKKRGRKPKKTFDETSLHESYNTSDIQNDKIHIHETNITESVQREVANNIQHIQTKKRGRKPTKTSNETTLIESYNKSDFENEINITQSVQQEPEKNIHPTTTRKRGRKPKKIYSETSLEEHKDSDQKPTACISQLAGETLQSNSLKDSSELSIEPVLMKRQRKKNIKYTQEMGLVSSLDQRCKVPSKKIFRNNSNIQNQSDDDMDDLSLSKLKNTFTTTSTTETKTLFNVSDEVQNEDLIKNHQVAISKQTDNIETSDLLKILEGTDEDPVNEKSISNEAVSEKKYPSVSKRNSKSLIMSDYEYNIDKVVKESSSTYNVVAENENDLFDLETSGRPKRRKAQKNINYGIESDEDPFANVESSDEEPRKSKKGYRYDYDHEYRPGRDRDLVTSDSSVNDKINLCQDAGLIKKRKRMSKKSGTSLKKSSKKKETSNLSDIEIDMVDMFDVTTKEPNENYLPENDIEECLQSSVIMPKETPNKNQTSTWGTSKEFENFLAQKMNSTDLKIQKTSKKNVKAPLDIPVLNPNEPKSSKEEASQTNLICLKSKSTQTSTHNSIPMKDNVPLTSEQAKNACDFLKNIVNTTSELGQLMITKSEDFIKKKINTDHVVDTLKMDYCVSKSFLLFKLAKHNLTQMEEDLAKQYEEFLEKNKLLSCREKQNQIKPQLKPSTDDSDCEIVDEPIPVQNIKPKFNPKTVFLNKELSIKITKKASEDVKEKAKDKINIKGKHSVWLNDSVVVKKVNLNQSFLAQDSRNKKPPDNEIAKHVDKFFKNYKRQKALYTCAPFVSTNWLQINKKIICSYFTNADQSVLQDYPETSRNFTAPEDTNINNSCNEKKIKNGYMQPHTLFSLCSAFLKTQLLLTENVKREVNVTSKNVGCHCDRKKRIPQTLLVLSLSKLSECVTSNTVCLPYRESNNIKCYNVKMLKVLCHETILKYMFQEKGSVKRASQNSPVIISHNSNYGIKQHVPKTLLVLSLNKLSQCINLIHTSDDVKSNYSIHSKLHNVKSLKILCHEKILNLMFQEKCFYQPDAYIQSIITTNRLAIKGNDRNCLLKSDTNSLLKDCKTKNNVISLVTMCVKAIQNIQELNPILSDKTLQKTYSPNTLKHITFEIIKKIFCNCIIEIKENSKETFCQSIKTPAKIKCSDSIQSANVNKLVDFQSVDMTYSINIHKAQKLAELCLRVVNTYFDNSNVPNNDKISTVPIRLMTIGAVNTLSEEAFSNMEQQSVNEEIDSQFFDDDQLSYNDGFDSGLLEENEVHNEKVENDSWRSNIQIPDLKPSFVMETQSKDTHKKHTENNLLITKIKVEPLEVNNDDTDPITIKSEPILDPSNISIIPDSIVTKMEHHENLNNDHNPLDNPSFDGNIFESFVCSNKMMYALDDCNHIGIFSQSTLRVRRQHEPDSDPENESNMSLLIPQNYESMTVEGLKGSLLKSSSETDEEKDKNKNNSKEKKKIDKRKTRHKKVVSKEIFNVAKDKPLNNEVAIMTRKMREKIRQEEKQIESSDSDYENIPLSMRKDKGKQKSNKFNEYLEIQCNNVDSTEQITVSPNNIADSFTGFSAVDQNEIASYEKYVKYVYDKIIPKDNVPESNAVVSDKDNLDLDTPLISDVPIEMLECEPTMPIFDDDYNKYHMNQSNSNKDVDEEKEKDGCIAKSKFQKLAPPLPIFERHGWKCYQIDANDNKLYQNAQIVLEKLPESFVETYFQYQDFNARNAIDSEVARLTNLSSLKKVNNSESVTKNKKRRKTTTDGRKNSDNDDSISLNGHNSDSCDELTPSEDEGGNIEDELLQPVFKQTTENSVAKNCLMDDNDSGDEKLSSIKKELEDNPDSTDKSKVTNSIKKQHNVQKADLMLTADKMMNKELALLHAPVVLAENIQDPPANNSDVKPKAKNSKIPSHRGRIKSGNESSEEEKQWVTTKEKLLKKMEKKPEDTSIDDAKRIKLVNEFIERRNAAPELRKRNISWKKHYRKKKLLEQQKQMSVLSKELYGESSIVPGKKSSAAYFKGRRNIRKVIDKKSLARSTVVANMEEFERKRRLISKQNELREVLGCEEGVSVLVINDEVCLEYDFQDLHPIVSVHPFFTKVMKAHQYEGVKFMWDACFESLSLVESGHGGGGCILAHCMGLGKTLQVLALLHTVLTHPRVGMHRVLVCCPLSTVLNWVDEIHKWIGPVTDQIKVFELSKLKKTYERAFQLEDWYKGGGIFIIGYELFRSLTTLDPELDNVKVPIINKIRKALLDPGPDIIVCDEGHLLKNDSSVLAVAMSRVVTKRRIVLTGTPMQNNLREYYCMVNFIKPNLLGTYAEYSNRFENPIMNGQHRDSIEEDIKLMKARTHILHKVLEGCLQRQEASVLYPYLPKKHEYTVFIPLTKAQSDLYKHYLTYYAKHNKNNILKDFHILQKIWSHPQVLHNFQMKRNESNETIKGEIKLEDDLAQEELAANEDIKPGGTEVWWLQYLDGGRMLDALETSNKFVTLFRILDESVALGDKVLVFSTSLFTMDALEYFLKRINKWRLGHEYYRLDGSVPPEVRQKWCREFNADHNVNTKLFLISTRAGSLGLNMTAANRVVIMDTSWNPAHDIQSIFRVYRFGQKKDCYIYRLVALGTMEQKIYERSVTKQAVACRVVDEQQIDRHYNMAELTELYRFDEMGSCVAAGVAAGVCDAA